MSHRYIVVEGPTGCGKSELSRHLARYFDALLLTEQPEKNPFLELFYANAQHHALAAELHFLMRRTESVALIQAEDEKNQRIISDFLLEKDQIYAPAILHKEEESLYWQIKHRVMPEFPVPDLVIYLEANDHTLEERLRHANPKTFNLFPAGYLRQIHQEYRRFFHLYQHAPLLTVNIGELDLLNNTEHFELLIHTITHMQGSRVHLNLSE
ncbi:deoxynucleoside kinase [Stenoxybacter acetivorans]|uniref:deoxynucleoside kinase n=1 Tax=Stenoxybacter acetivorans TaxID=422441 RepID=UPI00056D4743|nr:deoxynucleoside kinase [Stenoxybacter acetivorans]